MHIDEIITRFKDAKKIGNNQYQCKCSSHKDDKASLTITEEDNKILMHCFARLRYEKHFSSSRIDRKRFV